MSGADTSINKPSPKACVSAAAREVILRGVRQVETQSVPRSGRQEMWSSQVTDGGVCNRAQTHWLLHQLLSLITCLLSDPVTCLVDVGVDGCRGARGVKLTHHFLSVHRWQARWTCSGDDRLDIHWHRPGGSGTGCMEACRDCHTALTMMNPCFRLMKASDDMTDTVQYVFAKFLYETLVNIF